MTPTLDRNRAFAEVHGEHTARSWQDGFLFDGNDNIMEGEMDEAQVKRFAEMKQQAIAVEKAKAAFREIMPGMDDAQVSKLINIDNLKPVTPNDADIDLAAWARGDQQVVFGKVTKLIRETYNIAPANKLQALEILAENGVIPPRSQTPTSPSL
jgi:hypothetical protein